MSFLEEGQLEDYEYPDDDVEGDSDDCYVNCPECGALVYDDSPQCTECDHYISAMPKILIVHEIYRTRVADCFRAVRCSYLVSVFFVGFHSRLSLLGASY